MSINEFYDTEVFSWSLVQWMCPVDTPLEAHAKMMRAAYGDDIRVVGIGPCIAYHRLSDVSAGRKSYRRIYNV